MASARSGDTAPRDTAQEPPTHAQLPPNILWVVADDLGTDKVSVYAEHPTAPDTPVIDSLAARGLMFRNAYVAPTCSPSRAALLTGRYGRRTGIGGVLHSENGSVELPLSEETLPELLSRAPVPYQSYAVGKWHLGGEEAPSGVLHPNLQGFEDFRGSFGNLIHPTEGQWPGYYNFEKVVNGEVVAVNTYATTDTTNDAISALQEL